MGPKIEILNFQLREKFGHHFVVKFCGESNDEDHEDQKRSLAPTMVQKGL